ncbi:hypothetical protein [Vibrio cholerae]|uniref:hypothetical protein n=1 Tax=Vibrio cholerae TaxID=666 RepID=UPI00115975AD|nr:hypothetical protein [Vibrio cholerae]TQQ36809.1 hypothetical protein FLL70_12395 [Vibrio cholerae]
MWWYGHHDAREKAQKLRKRGVVLKTMKYTGKATEDILVDGQLALFSRIAEKERQPRVSSVQADRDKLSEGEW